MKSEDLDAVFAPEKAGEVTSPPAEEPKEPEKAPEEPKAPAEAPQEPEPKPSEAAERPEHTVPLPKYLDTRDENKELKRRLAELEAKERKPDKIPDPVDDPDGFARYADRVADSKVTNLKFEMSDQMARTAHGAEVVEKATDWALERAQQDPVFAAQYMREAHPIDWIVRQHKRDGLVSQLGDDPDAYVRRRAAELGLTAPPAGEVPKPATEPPAEKPAAPTKSLIDQPSGGGIVTVPIGPTAGIDATFPG
jgi:hypothetical protein